MSCLIRGLILVLFNSGLWRVPVQRNGSTGARIIRDDLRTVALIGGLISVAVFSAVAGQNLIVGHSEWRGRATHIIIKEGVYWAALGGKRVNGHRLRAIVHTNRPT